MSYEERPLVSLFYRLLFEGDVAPARLEEVLTDLEGMPPAVRVRFDRPDLAWYASAAARRLEELAGPSFAVRAAGT